VHCFIHADIKSSIKFSALGWRVSLKNQRLGLWPKKPGERINAVSFTVGNGIKMLYDCQYFPPEISEVQANGGDVVAYATSWKVAGSSPDVLDFFNSPNTSSCTMALGSTQPLTEMSTRNLPGGKGRPARKADNLTAIYVPNV
jgi:hypothetical protein